MADGQVHGKACVNMVVARVEQTTRRGLGLIRLMFVLLRLRT